MHRLRLKFSFKFYSSLAVSCIVLVVQHVRTTPWKENLKMAMTVYLKICLNKIFCKNNILDIYIKTTKN